MIIITTSDSSINRSLLLMSIKSVISSSSILLTDNLKRLSHEFFYCSLLYLLAVFLLFPLKKVEKCHFLQIEYSIYKK